MTLFSRLRTVVIATAIVSSATSLTLTSTPAIVQASAFHRPVNVRVGTSLPTSGPSAGGSGLISFQFLGGTGFNICSRLQAIYPLSINASFVDDISDVATFTVPGVGTLYNHADNVPAGSYQFYDFAPSASYSVAPHTIVTFVETIYNATNETGGVYLVATANMDCTSGAIISTSYNFGGGSSNQPGPQIPAGFVLKKLTCTTPVYTNPGDVTAGSAQLINGQSWYVNPTAVKDSKGKSWTEVFDGGYTDGYIPTSCVNWNYTYVYGQ